MPTKGTVLIPHFSFSGEVILSTTYGLDIALKNDKYITLAKAGVDPVVPALNPGTYLVDVIPALKYVPDWMPGAGFKKTAKRCHLLAQAMKNSPFEAAQCEIVSSLVIPWIHSYGLDFMHRFRKMERRNHLFVLPVSEGLTMISASTSKRTSSQSPVHCLQVSHSILPALLLISQPFLLPAGADSVCFGPTLPIQ